MVNWRDIQTLNFENTGLTKNEKDHELERFNLSFNIALVKTFSNKKYKKFALFFTHVDEKDGFKIQMICPEAEFIRNLKKMLSATYNIEETDSILHKLINNFTLRFQNLSVGNNLAKTVVYDEQAGEITIGKYPLQMDFTTTSGLLFFIASMFKSEIMPLEGELIFENYNLRKFVIYYMDEKKIEFSRLKINADNYEEWDYYYPEYDKEVEGYRKIYQDKIEREFPDEHFQHNKKLEAPKNEEDFLDKINDIINDFKNDVECTGYKLLLDYDSDKLPSEDKCQILFDYSIRRYAKSQKIDLTREAETRRGTIDFRFSSTVHVAHVELKIASSSRLMHGLSKQLPTYMNAENVKLGFLIIFEFGDVDISRQKIKLEKRRVELEKEKEIKLQIVYVNARQKPSASKI